MLAYLAIAALFAAAEPVQEQFEDLDNQEELYFYDEESDEVVLNEECEYDDLVFFEEQCEVSEDFLSDEE